MDRWPDRRVAKREGWPEQRDGQIRGVDRREVVMRGVKRWVGVYERGMARWEKWPVGRRDQIGM
jgi:hypothetical protein